MLTDCHQASLLISQARERRLSLAERTRLSLHLGVCRACRNFAADLPVLGKAARALAADVPQSDAEEGGGAELGAESGPGTKG